MLLSLALAAGLSARKPGGHPMSRLLGLTCALAGGSVAVLHVAILWAAYIAVDAFV